MNIEFCMQDTTLIVILAGEIDHHTSVEIRETVDREYQKRRARNILFDFEKVIFMDSSGIGLLMGRYRTVSICGGYVGLYNVSTKVDQILSISGIYKLTKLYESREDAFACLV